MSKNLTGSKNSLSSDRISLLGDDDDASSVGSDVDLDASGHSSTALGGGVKFRASRLRANLTRTQKNRDPLFYYEIVSVLGVGSMGSVARVRKRKQVIGGSARTHLMKHYREQRRLQMCFDLPLVGGFFAYCLRGVMERREHGLIGEPHHNTATSSGNASHTSSNQSIIHQQAGGKVENYNDPQYRQRSNGDNNNETEPSGIIYAMKSIHLSRVTDPLFVTELKNEISILKRLDHPHIVKAIETLEWRNQIFIVMELCSGGDLYSRDPYTEPEAARIVTSIVSAIAYMHSKNILHRDLKYENILFVNSSPQAEVKLIDFGLSMKFGKGEELTEGVGTIYTMAPEVLKGSYSKQADIWSIGVIAFMLMSSQMPFYGRKRKHIVEQIMKGQYEFKGRRWKRISDQAKAFIGELLVVDPDDRADAEQALSMAWLNRRFTATVRGPVQEELDRTQASILQYAKYAKIKKIALLVCAHKSTTTEIGILRKVFQKYDTKRNGQLNYEQFKAALNDAGYSDSEYRTIFDAVDLDGTGKIRYTEFLAATIEAQGAISEERLAEAFDRLDADDSGYISAENLREMLGQDFPEQEIKAIIDEADITHDGKISYSDFLALWHTKSEENRMEHMKDIEKLGRAGCDSEDSDSLTSSRGGAGAGAGPGGDPEDLLLARSTFVEHKMTSEREKQRKKAENKMRPKGVFFGDAVETIPTPVITFSEDSTSNDNDNNNSKNGGQSNLKQQEQHHNKKKPYLSTPPPLPVKKAAVV